MKVAIPYWQGRVSPVFDVAARLLLVEYDGTAEQKRQEMALEVQGLQERAACLSQAGVDVLICGAISWPLEMAVSAAGIEVIGRTCGGIEQVLAAFLDGRLRSGAFLMPGCCGRQRRFRGGRWNRPRNEHY